MKLPRGSLPFGNGRENAERAWREEEMAQGVGLRRETRLVDIAMLGLGSANAVRAAWERLMERREDE